MPVTLTQYANSASPQDTLQALAAYLDLPLTPAAPWKSFPVVPSQKWQP